MGKGKQIYLTEMELTSLLYLIQQWQDMLMEQGDPNNNIGWLLSRGAGTAWHKLIDKSADISDFKFVANTNPHKKA